MSALTSTRDQLSVAVEALEIIAGERQCRDNLMGNVDVAKQALSAIADGNLNKSLVLAAFDRLEAEDNADARRNLIERKNEAHFKAKQKF